MARTKTLLKPFANGATETRKVMVLVTLSEEDARIVDELGERLGVDFTPGIHFGGRSEVFRIALDTLLEDGTTPVLVPTFRSRDRRIPGPKVFVNVRFNDAEIQAIDGLFKRYSITRGRGPRHGRSQLLRIALKALREKMGV
jgi:hypothetical protein